MQIRLQFLADAILITWLVSMTGGISSPYVTLYIILIGVTSIYLRPLETLLTAVGCTFLFVLMELVFRFGLLETVGPEPTFSKSIQIVSFNVVAFFAVGLLASRLADRRLSGETLKETAKSLADLRALHERIVESIRSGLIITDRDGTIYTANAAASEMIGQNLEGLAGRSITQLFGDVREQIRLSETITANEQLPRFETDLRTPDGFAVHVGYSVSLLRSEDNEPTGYIFSFQDLSEIRSMEESVRRKDRLAAVGRVGAGLAHEIRNPLGAMRGAIQLLESKTEPGSVQADLMGIILRESDRLNSIITNFLNYAKPKVGDFVEIDVNDAIRDTVVLLKHGPDVKPEHLFDLDLPPDPVFLSADETQLKQVFWNLSRNAINAMPSGGVLRIKVERLPFDKVRIKFADNGSGMPPEQVEKLFEPFSKSTSGGTGLGLSIVYQIVRDHNGSINVRSADGEGTTITIELPVGKKTPVEHSKNELSGVAGETPLADLLVVSPGEK
ncbi:MAG: PAS domain S-box protein [Acidobacteria bacterium]|nr:PAS domain S-box protein [Acidobacteriota bacterium]